MMAEGWIDQGGLLLLAGGFIVAGSIVRGGRWLRLALALAGLAGVADALLRQTGWPPLVLAAMLAAFNALAILRMAGKGGAMDSDAERFRSEHLSALSPGQARLLIDQGEWIEPRAGEMLTREGQPVDALYFLARGTGAVLVDNAIVGRVGIGDIIGEAVLAGPAATASATVRLAEDNCRLWFIPAARLSQFLAAQPAIAAELDKATIAALRDKLERANRTRSEG
jgi:CRP-like cAMP-binding protein